MIGEESAEVNYTGELDDKGRAHGRGKAITVDDLNIIFEGTFMNNRLHGFSMFSL